MPGGIRCDGGIPSRRGHRCWHGIRRGASGEEGAGLSTHPREHLPGLSGTGPKWEPGLRVSAPARALVAALVGEGVLVLAEEPDGELGEALAVREVARHLRPLPLRPAPTQGRSHLGPVRLRPDPT